MWYKVSIRNVPACSGQRRGKGGYKMKKSLGLGQAKHHSTKYPGVTFIESAKHDEQIFYVNYYDPSGKRRFEKVGGSRRHKMTAKIANDIRTDRGKGRELPNTLQRKEDEVAPETQVDTGEGWTFDALWIKWKELNAHKAGLYRDDTRYNKHLKETFGTLEPGEVVPLDVDRLKSRLMKKVAPDTIISVISLLRRIANFGPDKQLCPGLSFKIKMKDKNLKPRYRTETLTRRQEIIFKRKCRTAKNRQIGNLCELVLETAIRRGNAQNLTWGDVDLDKGFIRLRDMKSGGDEVNPISLKAIAILRNHEKNHRVPNSKYVFSGQDKHHKGRLSDRMLRNGVVSIRDAANLPLVDGKPFRPLHGLRHARASKWVDEGSSLFIVQRLLNHATPGQTARYSHLGDDALRRTLDSNGKG